MPNTTRRTAAEIKAELSALNGLLSQVPPTSTFGEDNHEAINAQIRVIEENMTYRQILEEYEDGDAHLFNGALDVLAWLRDDGTPVSEWWAEIVENHLRAPHSIYK